MAANLSDETIVKDELGENTSSTIGQATLDRVEKIKLATPNWKKKLSKTLLALAIPTLSLVLDTGERFDSYQNADPKIDSDLPDVEYSEMLPESPHVTTVFRDPWPDEPRLELKKDAFPNLTHKLEIRAGQTFDDLFKVELAKSLFPELKVTPHSFFDPKVSQKVNDGIEKYQQGNKEFYSDLHDKYIKGVKNLNPDLSVSPNEPIPTSAPVTSLSMSPIISELQLANLLQPIK